MRQQTKLNRSPLTTKIYFTAFYNCSLNDAVFLFILPDYCTNMLHGQYIRVNARLMMLTTKPEKELLRDAAKTAL